MAIPTRELVCDPVAGVNLPAVTVEPVSMIERLASNPDVDVDKLERMMAMKERADLRHAEEMFNAAMSKAQQAMRPIAADATNPQTRSRYATYAALDRALRPIYTDHGFGMSFNTGETTIPEWVRVLAYVSHSGGFARTYHIDMPADGKGAKGGDVMTKTHAVGAAMSYGMRYLLKMIWNVAVGEDDRDGNDPPQRGEQKPAPSGYQDWLDNITAVADNGFAAFEMAWADSKQEYRNQLTKDDPKTLARLKTRARQVGAK